MRQTLPRKPPQQMLRTLLCHLVSKARWTPWTSNGLLCSFYLKWQSLYDTGNLRPPPAHSSRGELPHSPPAPVSPSGLLRDTEPTLPPHPERLRGDARRHLKWPERGSGAMRGDGEEPSPAGALCALQATRMKSKSDVAPIKKQMTRCWSLFRRLAHSLLSHQPPLQSYTSNTHYHTRRRKTYWWAHLWV